MLETSRLIRLALAGLALLLLAPACSTANASSNWADETAQDVCLFALEPASAVVEIDGETVLVVGATWPAEDDAQLDATRLTGANTAAGLDPETGVTPDKILCLSSARGDVTECPDGSVIDESSKTVKASLHSIALSSELGTTEVGSTASCRLSDSGDASLASTSTRRAGPPDAYDIDQVLCNLLTCVLDDTTASELSAFRAGDPRAEVCGFTERFVDGVIELEDGPVYVAHELGYRDALADATPAIGTTTDRTMCIQAEGGATQVSCGEYQLEGQHFGGVTVRQSSVRVNGRWFEGDAVEPGASASADYYSECTEEISIVTTTYGSSSVGITNRNDRLEHSTMTAEHVTWMAEELQQWSVVNAGAPSLSAADCTAVSGIALIDAVMRRLDSYDDEMTTLLTMDPPAGLAEDVERLQTLTSELFEGIGEDSALFDPVFELWYIAYFNWPLINTFADPSDPDATDEDFTLTLMGMPARVGLVSIVEPAFATRHETVQLLADIHRDHC